MDSGRETPWYGCFLQGGEKLWNSLPISKSLIQASLGKCHMSVPIDGKKKLGVKTESLIPVSVLLHTTQILSLPFFTGK
jgi:hypothetical protein